MHFYVDFVSGVGKALHLSIEENVFFILNFPTTFILLHEKQTFHSAAAEIGQSFFETILSLSSYTCHLLTFVAFNNKP